MSYTIGDLGRLSVSIYSGPDSSFPLVDPTALTLRVMTPGGVETTYTWPAGAIVRDVLGKFHADVPFTEAGSWRIRWKATGAAQAAHEGVCLVEKSSFTNP